MGQQTLNLKAAGLWLTSNPLDAPPGALANAQNAVIRRPNVVEPRRGQKPDALLSAPADAMATFEGAVIAHSTDGVLARRVDATSVSAYTGTWDPPTGYPMRFAEAGGGLYATTDEGPIRLDSPASVWVASGVPPGLEGTAAVTGASGWLPTGSTVGYRFVWGTKDGDGAVLIGAPSGRVLVANASGGDRDVVLTTPIPDGVSADAGFLLVYRTVITATTPDDPGEDMAQVGEFYPTATQITAGLMTVTDVASFAGGPRAYFSPSNGAGGIADAHEQPPLLSDAIAFKGYLFGVVSAYRQNLQLTLLAVGSGGGVLGVSDGLSFTDGTTTETYTAEAAESFPDEFELVTSGTASQNIEATARSFVRAVNSRAGGMLFATYASGPNDLPGKIVVTARDVDRATLSVSALINGDAWVPRMANTLGLSTASRTAGVVTLDTGGNPHGLSVGDSFTLLDEYGVPSDRVLFPPGVKTVASVPAANQLTYVEAGADGNNAGSMTISTTAPSVSFEQEATSSSWAHSAFEEPDAFPPRFHYQVGGPNTRLDRITSQGEALLFWTSDGLYRLTGDDEDSFTLRPLDPTVKLTASRTPMTVGNRAYAFTTQGLVSVTEIGVEKVSTPMDTVFLPYYGSTEAAQSVTATAAFAVAYESENEYILFLPAPDASPGDPADRAYTYNAQTRTWVGPWIFEWSTLNPTDHFVTTGIVGPDNRLYVAAGDNLTRERKDRALSDQQDADGVGIPYDVAYLVQTAGNPGAYKQWVECTEMLEAPQPSAVELYFATEIDTSEEGGSIPSQGNSNVRTYIPLNKSRSARLTVGLRHEAPLEKPVMLGLSVVYNVNGTRVGR